LVPLTVKPLALTAYSVYSLATPPMVGMMLRYSIGARAQRFSYWIDLGSPPSASTPGPSSARLSVKLKVGLMRPALYMVKKIGL